MVKLDATGERERQDENVRAQKKKDLGFVPKKNTFVESITFYIKAVFDVSPRETRKRKQGDTLV